ncbi:MAG TPA: DUF4433 domain-containing protein [Planctomycetes bacterium]|nr:DUF4433 domain-containing protein [Planctomycetota bacterium]
MTTPPDHPKIYHMTHVGNLAGIIADGHLASESAVSRRGVPVRRIGIAKIKRRRVEELPIHCHTGTNVADYVPFYFCPRSVMLYVIHCNNNPDLTYHGGQGPIVHLQADLHAAIEWAERHDRRWAFSLSNAGAFYCEFRSRTDQLDQLDWPSIAASDFRPVIVKEHKQAEFLMHESFPFDLVERIGVQSDAIRTRAEAALAGGRHRPPVEIHREWYF